MRIDSEVVDQRVDRLLSFVIAVIPVIGFLAITTVLVFAAHMSARELDTPAPYWMLAGLYALMGSVIAWVTLPAVRR